MALTIREFNILTGVGAAAENPLQVDWTALYAKAVTMTWQEFAAMRAAQIQRWSGGLDTITNADGTVRVMSSREADQNAYAYWSNSLRKAQSMAWIQGKVEAAGFTLDTLTADQARSFITSLNIPTGSRSGSGGGGGAVRLRRLLEGEALEGGQLMLALGAAAGMATGGTFDGVPPLPDRGTGPGSVNPDGSPRNGPAGGGGTGNWWESDGITFGDIPSGNYGVAGPAPEPLQVPPTVSGTGAGSAPYGGNFPAGMQGGVYTDLYNGRPAYVGPEGQPGYPDPGPGRIQGTMPDGRTVYYDPTRWTFDDPSRPAITPTEPAGAGTRTLQGTGITAIYNPATGQFEAPGDYDASTSPTLDPAIRERAASQERTSGQRSAIAAVKGVLESFGLGQMADWAWSKIVNGVDINEILFELRQSDIYKARFPGMEARKAAGLPAISEGEYLEYETKTRQILRGAGLPTGFFDQPGDVAYLMGENLSLAEIQDRVTAAYTQVQMAPQEVRDVMGSYFGPLGDVALAAYALDPDRTLALLSKQVETAKVGGFGRQFGFDLNAGRSGQIVEAGVGGDQSREGFARIRQLDSLFNETISETRDLTKEGEGVAAIFNLGDPEAAQVIERRRKSRSAAFAGSSSYVTSGEGASLGAAE